MQDKELWARLLDYSFDAAQGSEPYSVKLANAEGWSKEYTGKVIEEYRKFLYLCTISKLPITPSEAVDRAWHMHLTFTRDYWEVLCKQVLQRDLHHEPCAGSEEMPRYDRQYADTLALYRVEFGATAPAEVWGGPSVPARAKSNDYGLYAACLGGLGFVSVLLLAKTPWSLAVWILCIACLAITIAGLIEIATRGKRYTSNSGAGCGGAYGGTSGNSGWFGSSDGGDGGSGGGAGCGGGGCGS